MELTKHIESPGNILADIAMGKEKHDYGLDEYNVYPTTREEHNKCDCLGEQILVIMYNPEL